MTLGALIVVAVLAVAAIGGWKIMKARAGGDQASQTTTTNPPSGTSGTTTSGTSTQPQSGGQTTSTTSTTSSSTGSNPNANPSAGQTTGTASGGTGIGNGAAPPATGTSQGAGLPATANAVIPGTGTSSKNPKIHNAAPNQVAGGGLNGVPGTATGGDQTGTTPATGGGAAAQPPAVDTQKLAQLEQLHDQLAARAVTVDQGVENLRKQLQSTGDSLGSKFTAPHTRMKMDMDQFDAAMNRKDLDAAEKYRERAEREIETLEKLLNIQ